MRLSELMLKLVAVQKMNMEMDKNFGEWENDPEIFISIGPTCIPISGPAETVASTFGARTGLVICLDMDAPEGKNQEWFDLQRAMMEKVRDDRIKSGE